ncbi:reverse transcriptase domain-containing protein [Agrobacterium genomosp. 13]|uniref:RNA-directed DNA polymerase (Reverse transcriptase) protein n=1 Tax=Agrobacterium genomosp. 13 str. CFBP 6927 TaxID=1183428 RepID=A0ABM9VI93_9HYPH|nr:reverse transcriptase domain-containing protein [Agrobacterium genomosp. 13]CUX43754.1 putative RNA-directed DNA polymerase (Reverse transcriptase) protein [Agrobacterium genomosp. 13 str. CFBP 6927]
MTPKEIFDAQFSASNLIAIFHDRVSQSGTVGRDGIHPAAFEKNLDQEIALIRKNIAEEKYRFTTYKQRLVLKGAGKAPREISIAGVRDRVCLRALNNSLSAIFTEAKPALAHQYIAEIKAYIKPLSDDYSFVQLDVQNFFPSLLHEELLKRLRRKTRYRKLLSVVSAAIRTSTGASGTNNRGVPQGLSISNVLSSIYMIPIDEEAHGKYEYYRYVDDILIICKTENASTNLDFMMRRLAKVGLICHSPTPGSKTKIELLSGGVEYLGYHLTPDKVSIRKSSYRNIMENLVSVVTAAKYKSADRRQVRRLNLKITGCFVNGKRYGSMFYFSMTDDKEQLMRLDRFVGRLWKKAGFEKYGKPKTFVKTFHEIKYNVAETKYIPRFDDYTIDQMMQFIADFEAISIDEVRDWTEEKIRKTFKRYIKREVSDLLKDMTPTS